MYRQFITVPPWSETLTSPQEVTGGYVRPRRHSKKPLQRSSELPQAKLNVDRANRLDQR